MIAPVVAKTGLAGVFWLLAAGTVAAADLTLSYAPIQGGLVKGSTAPEAVVTLDGKGVAVSKSGLFVLGFGRDAKPTASLVVRLPGGKIDRQQLAVKQRKYKIQRIDGDLVATVRDEAVAQHGAAAQPHELLGYQCPGHRDHLNR